MNKSLHIAYCSLLIAILLISCENNRFTFFQTFDGNCWKVNDTLSFTQQVTQPTKIAFQAKYNEDYNFQNIYLRLFIKNPSGRDTSYIVLDTLMDKLGKWRDNGSKKHTLSMQDTLSLNLSEKGAYQFKIIQYMRKDTLCGIESLGINVL